MKEKTETFNQGKRYFFYILMFAILGWFIFMQIFGADERSSDTSAASVIYSGTVTWQKPDGTTQEISVPGTYKVPVGDTMVLTIQLPDDLTDTCFAIRSSLQDVDFYVGDNLRTSYSTHKTRLHPQKKRVLWPNPPPQPLCFLPGLCFRCRQRAPY